jgi:hypothetical protein
MTTKVCTTEDLVNMARGGRNAGLNRQLNIPLIDSMVDKSKVCVISLLLFGHNMDDQNKPLHHRVQGLLPVKGTTEPLEVIFDVLASHFDQLTDAQQIVDANK